MTYTIFFFILPDPLNEYLRHFFTKHLKLFEKSNVFGIFDFLFYAFGQNNHSILWVDVTFYADFEHFVIKSAHFLAKKSCWRFPAIFCHLLFDVFSFSRYLSHCSSPDRELQTDSCKQTTPDREHTWNMNFRMAPWSAKHQKVADKSAEGRLPRHKHLLPGLARNICRRQPG